MVAYGGAIPYETAVKIPLTEVERLVEDYNKQQRAISKDFKK